jgi:hypothetical protein
VERPRLERRLRGVVHLVLALCMVIAFVAKLSGWRIYVDSNNCVGNGLEGLANTESRPHHCTPSYDRLDHTDEAGGWAAIVFVIAVAIGGGIVYLKPTRATAITWVVWTVLAASGAAAMSVHLNLFDDAVELWPSHVLVFAAGVMLVLIVIATPIILIATRETPTGSSAIARRRSRNP